MEQVESRIADACDRSGRPREDVRIIAVTKYSSLENTERVVRLGLRHIGESRWQDAKVKWETIGDEAEWHFIGHLQTNKVKDVVGKCTYIHSLDRPGLADEIHKKAAALGIRQKVFIQLNVSGEETKFGLAPDKLMEFAEHLKGLPGLDVCGLMTMAPYEARAEETRPVFRRLRELRDELNERGILPQPVNELSMGMSNDFEVAVEEGATWIRLGTVLMGKE
ncbi:YggS family pyridoxal phosphate-dependent enzyme [Paenibacillus aurantius]|uniref:Pyridoxal phosphate homeostasis protein n=1 Tax=Paenibacillus aurantius TaxID=2918900 RepID=A0AA96RHM9_9BACL|nr:YggS family pyridoxal phosphate-dependent enzyme [Paenibacillus aurantius]WNQ13528.1 YggS family pyridoxal phosphate-dependent enzyme [Paenibacillus aurantius]